MTNLRPLGRIVQHDPRSRSYRYAAERAGQYATVYHPPTISLDQGDIGSCTGNASAHALSTAELGRHALTENDARDRIYHLATTLDDIAGTWRPDDTGSSGLAAAKACQHLGYLSGYTHVLSVADGLAALQHTAIITGVDWYEGFDNPDGNGRVKISGQVRGGHEFCLWGFDADTGLIWAKNSWAGWGVTHQGVDQAFCFDVATWTRLLASQGDATVFVPAAQPAPTPTPASSAVQLEPDIAARVDHLAARAKLTDGQWVNRNLRHYLHLN